MAIGNYKQPLSQGPAVGFALWHMQRGMSLEQIDALMETTSPYSMLSSDNRADAIAQATIDYEATTNAQAAAAHLSWGRVFPSDLIAGESIGVRLMVDIRYPDGTVRKISVTMNVSQGQSIVATIEQAIAGLNSGALNRPGRPDYPVEVVIPSDISSMIGQVVQGGYESPLFNFVGGVR